MMIVTHKELHVTFLSDTGLYTLVINMIREPYGNTKMMIADVLRNIKNNC